MKKKRFFLFLVLALAVFAALLWFQANRLLRSSKVQELLTRKIQTATEGILRFQGLEVGFFPQPVVTLLHPQLAFPDQPLTLEAEKLRFDFEIFPMVLGRAEPSAVYVVGGKADARLPWLPFLGELPLRNFTLKMGALRPNLPIPVQFESDVGDKKRAVSAKGHFVAASLEKIDWERTGIHFMVELKDLPLASVKEPAAGAKSAFYFKSGTLIASLEVKKEQKAPALALSATGKIGGIGYEVMQEKTWVTPPVLDVAWKFSGEWDTATEEVKIQKMNAELPFANFEANGDLKLRTGEIQKIHFTASNVVLESLLKYWPGLEEAIPLHIGFSGSSQLGLSLEGTLDHLSLHLSLDLTQTLLTYGAYFTKTKDAPLTVTFDYLIQKGETLTGDFSARFQDMSLKGNLTDLNLANGDGQLNLITNKFTLKGWEQYIPVLQGYKIDGNAKILANWKGDLRQLEKAEQIFHVTIEKGLWTDAEGKGIKNAELSFDYSPLMFEGRGMQFDLGGSPVAGDLKITGAAGDLEAQLKIASGELNPAGAWENITALFRGKKTKAEKDIYDHVQDSILALFPKGQALKELSTELRYLKGDWEVQKFDAKAYDGTIDLKGSIGLAKHPVQYRCEGEVKGMNVSSFLNRAGGDQKKAEGSLVMKLSLEGTGWGKDAWADSLKGHGNFTLTNGTIPALDVLKPLSALGPFGRLEKKAKDLRAFDQMDFGWQLSKGKISTENFLIKAQDHIIDGEGTIGFDGLVNFRWEVFLTTALATEIFPEMASKLKGKTKAHFGPIPMLVSGPIFGPELKPDPELFEELTQLIRKKETKHLLYELVLD